MGMIFLEKLDSRHPFQKAWEIQSLKWNEVYSSKLLQRCETCNGSSFKTVMFSYHLHFFKDTIFFEIQDCWEELT